MTITAPLFGALFTVSCFGKLQSGLAIPNLELLEFFPAHPLTMYKPPESFEDITRRKRDKVFLYTSMICSFCGMALPFDIIDRMGTFGIYIGRFADFFPMIASYSGASVYPQITKLTLLCAMILVPFSVFHWSRHHRLIFNYRDLYRTILGKYFGWVGGLAIMMPFITTAGGSSSVRSAAFDFIITHSRIAISLFSSAICIFISFMISAAIFWVIALFTKK